MCNLEIIEWERTISEKRNKENAPSVIDWYAVHGKF